MPVPIIFVPGVFRIVSTPFTESTGAQPPKVLKTAVEVFANLRQLQQSHDPLVISFPERSQRFQSYLVEVNRERGLIALDELVPNDGERFIKNGESFNIEGFHEGVRIAWKCEQKVQIGELEGARCYWSALPAEVLYHQRRNAFRVPLKPGRLLAIELTGDKLKNGIRGQLLDMSATGCKLRFQGDLCNRLQPGQVYEHLSLQLPLGPLTTAAELRHLSYQDKLDVTFAGMRFANIDGLAQRQVERFVFQLQRDARQLD
jgi:c-di-GMP-binding flagellar brake protein YcgR